MWTGGVSSGLSYLDIGEIVATHILVWFLYRHSTVYGYYMYI